MKRFVRIRPASSPRRAGFTLIELLVVVSIIAILIALIIPAVQAARDSARQNACRNNLRQFGIALSAFESNRNHFPASWNATIPNGTGTGAGNIDGWSGLALVLPYLEQKDVFNAIDFSRSYKLTPTLTAADGTTINLAGYRNPTFLCPAEVRDEDRGDGNYPFNYAFNLGTWLFFDPATNTGGSGVFFPTSAVKAEDIRDGLSNTLAMAEVKGHTQYYRNTNSTTVSAMPSTPDGLAALLGTPESVKQTGHTEWVDGRSHHAGFTTTFRPNAKVPGLAADVTAGTGVDVDWNNHQEGVGGMSSSSPPSFGAITARSYHGGKVNVVMCDGGVRSIDDIVNLGVWQAISTRAGKEFLPESFHKDN